jgi:hypothetical protein
MTGVEDDDDDDDDDEDEAAAALGAAFSGLRRARSLGFWRLEWQVPQGPEGAEGMLLQLLA